jgi:hypothetical protein
MTRSSDFSKREIQEELLRRKFQIRPDLYLQTILGIELWKGVDGPGQAEIVADIGESVRKQLAGEKANKIFRVEAGHGVGKTYVAAGLVNWFFDCFPPSITITTAPSDEQVRLLLWKEIKTLRRGRNLPGRVLEVEPFMSLGDDHFAIGRTTSDSGGQGTARMQGQHPKFWLYVLDEAEGVPDFVFGAVEGMMTGGTVGIVLMLANPQTRTSRFHKAANEPGVSNYRISVLSHPNVVSGKEIVPGATKRDWALSMIAKHCEVVQDHDDDQYTFTVGYPVEKDGVEYPAGTIFLPNPEFCFRVLGVAPANLADRCFTSPGRYEAAEKRQPDRSDPEICAIGVDCARFGGDAGTIYVRHCNVAWRAAQIMKDDSFAYLEAIKKPALEAAKHGAKRLSVRVDGTGGFGSGVVDLVRADEELRLAYPDGEDYDGVVVYEIQFGESAKDRHVYADIITQLYAEAAETLKGIRVERVPAFLKVDLTERPYEYINRAGVTLKKLQDKEIFRKKNKNRSPDDGDGFVLAVAPEHALNRHEIRFL